MFQKKNAKKESARTKKQKNLKKRKDAANTAKKIGSDLRHVKDPAMKAAVIRRNQDLVSLFFKDQKDGIFQIQPGIYSITLEYSDISFAKASDEEVERIFHRYMDFLNGLAADVHLQVTNVSTPINTDRFKSAFRFETEGLTDKEARLAGEFNDLIDSTIGIREKTLISKRYLTLSLKAADFEDARKKFEVLVRTVEEKFKELGSQIRQVKTNERLRIIHDALNLETADAKRVTNLTRYAVATGQSLQDVTAPREDMIFREADYIETRGEEKSRFIRTLYLIPSFPTQISPKLYNRLTGQDDIHMITTLNIQPTEITDVIKKLKRQKSGLETERYDKIRHFAKQGLDYGFMKDEKLETAIEDVERLIEAIQYDDQKVFNENMLLTIMADTKEELVEHTKRIQAIAGEMLVSVAPVKWQQPEALANALPLGHNSFQIQHRETSEATAIHVPFNAKDFMDASSIFYGINMVSRNPIFLDRKKLINGNGCILATSGAGKSFQVKTIAEELHLRYPQDEMIFVDFQREYGPLVHEFDGQEIQIADNTETHINPLDISEGYSLADGGHDTPIKAKTEYMQGWIEAIMDEGPLDAVEKSIVDRCVRNVFYEYERSGFKDKRKQPLLKDFQAELNRQDEIEAKRLAKSLERFVIGALNMFSYPTNVQIHNKVVSFDISQLPSSIQTAGYLVVLDHIMNRLSANRLKGVNTWIFIDEFHILLANQAGAEYVAKMVKVGRKYGAFITVITQNIADVYENEAGHKILGNSEFAIILRQKETDRAAIQEIFSISDSEAKFFASDAKQGQGVIVYGSDKVPFYNPVPRDTRIYALNNTDSIALQKT